MTGTRFIGCCLRRHAQCADAVSSNAKEFAVRIIPLLAAAVAAVATPAQAGDIRPFSPAAFSAAQAHNGSQVVFVHAPWCPICRAQEQTIRKLLATPRYRDVHVLKIDFDSQKPLWTKFGATKQSTLIAFHGRRETARLSYDTDPAKVTNVVASSLR